MGSSLSEPFWENASSGQEMLISLFKKFRENEVFPCLSLSITAPEELAKGRKLVGKIRSYGTGGPCRVIEAGEGEITVEFDQGQFAPCPGQRLVLYNSDDNIVAGGVIAQTDR